MITVLSCNTALDQTMLVPHFQAGQVFRAEETHTEPGGKALNVARTVRQLGASVRVIGFLGGNIAPLIEAGCAALGIEQRWVRIAGASRTCIIVVDPVTGRQTVLNPPGPSVTAAEVRSLFDLLCATLQPGDLLAISGSAPPGVPDGWYGEVVRAVPGVRVLVDAAGARLAAALDARPWAVAPNQEETISALGPAQPCHLLDQLERASQVAILTQGARGALVALPSGRWRLVPPDIAARNAVGCGDALVGGFLTAIAGGADLLEAARFGVAAGTANAARLEQGVRRAEVEALACQVRVEPLVGAS